MTGLRLALAAVLLTPQLVTQAQFDAVQPGWSRHHVEREFGSAGQRVTEWIGGKGWVHQWRNYPAEDGRWAQITYVHSPHGTHWHVATHDGKALCPEFHDPCNEEAS